MRASRIVVCVCMGVVVLMAGCIRLKPPAYPLVTSISMKLLALENNKSFIPRPVFVERYGARNLLAEGDNESTGSTYTMGIAVLVVTNNGNLPVQLAPWHEAGKWRILLESQNGTMKTFDLRPDRFGCVMGDESTRMILDPGEDMAFVFGLDDCAPYETYGSHAHCPWPACKMRVEYCDGHLVYRTNPLRMRCREKSGEGL